MEPAPRPSRPVLGYALALLAVLALGAWAVPDDVEELGLDLPEVAALDLGALALDGAQ